MPRYKFVFLDIETTGLDPDKDYMLEIAALKVSGGNEVVAVYDAVIDPALGNGITWQDRMNDYARNMHTENGLLEDIQAMGQDIGLVEDGLIKFLESFHNEGEQFMIAGNSIYFDRSFLRIHMPCLFKRLHYRMLDCSSLKMAIEQNWPGLAPRKANSPHRAEADARESLAIYKHFIHQLNPKRRGW